MELVGISSRIAANCAATVVNRVRCHPARNSIKNNSNGVGGVQNIRKDKEEVVKVWDKLLFNKKILHTDTT